MRLAQFLFNKRVSEIGQLRIEPGSRRDYIGGMYGLPWNPPPLDAIKPFLHHLHHKLKGGNLGAQPPWTRIFSRHNLRLIPERVQQGNPPKGFIKMNACQSNEIEYITPIPEDYYERVIVHLRNNFFTDEPLNNSVGLCQKGESNEELEKHSLATLKDRLSVMAINPYGEVVAVVLNGILREKDVEESQAKLEDITDEKFKTIFRVLYKLNHSLELFTKYDVDKMFECRILSVDTKYRGLGLANKLMVKSEKLAKESGFKMFKTDSTGLFSQRTLIKLGHEVIFEINYEDIKDDNGDQIFKTNPPHTCLKIMIKMLN